MKGGVILFRGSGADARRYLESDRAVTWEVCRRILDSVEVSSPKSFGALTGNLIAVLVRLYRSSDNAGRETALDLIDRTVLLQLWRVDQVLDDAR